MKNPFKTGAVAALVLALSGAADAALVSRGGGMVYDTTQNLTWLADMNHAGSSGYAAANATEPFPHRDTTIKVGGQMGWTAANAWAAGLTYGGFDDWRLPGLNPSDTSCPMEHDLGPDIGVLHYGQGCTGGELSHLFVVDLGNRPGESVLDTTGDSAEQIANLALFSNVPRSRIWSGTDKAAGTGLALYFDPGDAFQGNGGKGSPFFALAVRNGDVAAVPEPQTLALTLLALGAATGGRRKWQTRRNRNATYAHDPSRDALSQHAHAAGFA